MCEEQHTLSRVEKVDKVVMPKICFVCGELGVYWDQRNYCAEHGPRRKIDPLPESGTSTKNAEREAWWQVVNGLVDRLAAAEAKVTELIQRDNTLAKDALENAAKARSQRGEALMQRDQAAKERDEVHVRIRELQRSMSIVLERPTRSMFKGVQSERDAAMSRVHLLEGNFALTHKERNVAEAKLADARTILATAGHSTINQNLRQNLLKVLS